MGFYVEFDDFDGEHEIDDSEGFICFEDAQSRADELNSRLDQDAGSWYVISEEQYLTNWGA